MRGGAQQYLALVQRFADQAELILFEIAKAAVDQFGRGRAGMARQIVLLDEQHVEPAPRRVARDRRPVDAAADDEEIEGVHGACLTVMPNPSASSGHA